MKDRKLQLIAEKEMGGAVYSLNPFNDKLLVANHTIQLYKWMLAGDGSRELECGCDYMGYSFSLDIQTRNNFMIMKSMSLLVYKVVIDPLTILPNQCHANQSK